MSLVTGAQVLAGPEYIEETTYGSLPASGSMSFIGVIRNFDPRADMRSLLVPQLGSRDLREIIAGAKQYDVRLEYAPYDTVFAKYGVNAAGGVGTIEKSLSIRTKLSIGGVTKYLDALGCRINAITLRGRVGELVTVDADVWAKQVPDYMTETAGGVTDATDPGTDPYTFASGGASPVVVGTDTPDVREISVSVNNGLERVFVLGAGEIKYLPYQGRRINGSILIFLREGVYYGYAVGDTLKTITWTIASTKTLTLTDSKLTRLESFAFREADLVAERWHFETKQAALA